MNIYLSSARDPQNCVVSGVTNPVPARIPALTSGNSVLVNVYTVNGSGSYDTDATATGNTALMSLSRAGEAAVTSVAMGTITNGWAAYLDLTTQELADLYAGGSDPVTLNFTFTVTDSSGRARTYAQVPVQVYNTTTTEAAATPVQEVFYYDGDPNGHVTARGAALCYGAGGTVYRKTSLGTSNNEWELFIGGAA